MTPISSQRGYLPSLLSVRGKHSDAAQSLHAAITRQNDETREFFDSLDPRLLRHTAKEGATLSTKEIDFLLPFLASLDLITAGGSQRVSRLIIGVACYLAPLLPEVRPLGAHTSAMIHPIVKSNFLECMQLVWRNNDNVFWGSLTGTYMTLRKGDDVLLRGHYFRYSTIDKMPSEDTEWFGKHWASVLTVWSRLEAENCFTRQYAEALINGIDEHGTALADGIL